MEIIKDLKMIYSKAIKETISKIKKNPIVILLPLIFSIILSFVSILLSKAGGGYYIGFIIPLVYALILSVYYDMLSDLIYYNRVRISNIGPSSKRYFVSIYSIYFVLMIFNILSTMLFAYNQTLTIIFWAIIFIVFNPVIESIYLKGEHYVSAFSYSANFMKENFIQWIIPLVVFMLLQLALGFSIISYIMDNGIINLSIGTKISFNMISGNILYYVKYLILELLTGFYIVFRGNLFKILSSSTMRKRKYMGDI